MHLLHYEKSSIILMVQSYHVVFCYYTISPMTIKEFEDMYGEGSWIGSKPILKVYEIEKGISKEIETIYLDVFADNWYINLYKPNIDVFVKLGRILPNDKFVSIAISNTVITPRDSKDENSEVYYIDISKHYKEDINKVLPVYSKEYNDEIKNNEPKPYPFKNKKNNQGGMWI